MKYYNDVSDIVIKFLDEDNNLVNTTVFYVVEYKYKNAYEELEVCFFKDGKLITEIFKCGRIIKNMSLAIKLDEHGNEHYIETHNKSVIGKRSRRRR